MLQNFSRSLFQLTHKYQIAQSLSSTSRHPKQAKSSQSIGILEFQSIINAHPLTKVNTQCLKRLLFAQSDYLDQSKLASYLQVPQYPHNSTISIICTQSFAELMKMESQLFQSIRRLQKEYWEHWGTIFESIDTQNMKTIDSFSVCNFVKKYSGSYMSSQTAKSVLELIKEGKGDNVSRQEWIRYFTQADKQEVSMSRVGVIKNNRLKLLEKKLRKCESYEGCEKQNPITIRAKFIQKEEKKIGSIKKVGSIQNLITYQSRTSKPKSCQKFYDSYRVSSYPDQIDLSTAYKLNCSIDKTCFQKTQRIRKQPRRQELRDSSAKHPYQIYLDSKKVSKDKENIIQNLSSLNDLIAKREQSISRILIYPEFNLFNAFNVLDSYDIGGINYGEFCRQLDNLGLVIEEQTKRNFWNQVTRGSRQGLCFEDFTKLFRTTSTQSYYEELKTRQPAPKRFDGIGSWKKQLQYSYKEFLREMIDNFGASRKIKLKIREGIYSDQNVLKMLVSQDKIRLKELNQKLGSKLDLIFGEMVQDEEELTVQKFNHYFAK